MEITLLINVKIPTIVSSIVHVTFRSRINSTSENFKAKQVFILKQSLFETVHAELKYPWKNVGLPQGLFWVQTVFKCYQQTALAGKELTITI